MQEPEEEAEEREDKSRTQLHQGVQVSGNGLPTSSPTFWNIPWGVQKFGRVLVCKIWLFLSYFLVIVMSE